MIHYTISIWKSIVIHHKFKLEWICKYNKRCFIIKLAISTARYFTLKVICMLFLMKCHVDNNTYSLIVCLFFNKIHWIGDQEIDFVFLLLWSHCEGTCWKYYLGFAQTPATDTGSWQMLKKLKNKYFEKFSLAGIQKVSGWKSNKMYW